MITAITNATWPAIFSACHSGVQSISGSGAGPGWVAGMLGSVGVVILGGSVGFVGLGSVGCVVGGGVGSVAGGVGSVGSGPVLPGVASKITQPRPGR